MYTAHVWQSWHVGFFFSPTGFTTARTGTRLWMLFDWVAISEGK